MVIYYLIITLEIFFSILEPPEVLPLSFGKEIMSEADFAQLSCIAAKGDQPLTFAWSFHGSSITNDLDIITTPIGSKGSMLVISSVDYKHRGKYSCTAKNSAGARTQTAELKVNGNILSWHWKYSFYLESPDLMPLTFGRDVLNENDLGQVSCIATRGDEPMTVTWTFHGNSISSDLDIMITPIGGRGSNLLIMKIGHRHSGIFTCTASNSAGSSSESIELLVNGNYCLGHRKAFIYF